MTAILREKIRSIPDFPRKGVVFRDITPLLGDPKTFHHTIDQFVERYRTRGITKVVAIESRGYLIGAPLAYALNAGLVIVRKAGKLPHDVDRQEYELEYGADALEIHTDSLNAGDQALVVDDLLATGGTAEAAARLVERRGAKVAEFAFLVELLPLEGRKRLGHEKVFAILDY